jgi:hypothetical protein
LGSLVVGQQITVVFDTRYTSEQIFHFYQSQLLPQGWQELEYLWRGIGFQEVIHNERLFCRGEQGYALTISAFDLLKQPTQVRLVLELDTQHSRCAMESRRSRLAKLIPALLPPPQAHQWQRSASQGERYTDSLTILETNLALLDVAAHYEAQLPANWMLEQRGHDAPLAWSMWSFNELGQAARGIFFVLKIQDNPQQYFLFVRANF